MCVCFSKSKATKWKQKLLWTKKEQLYETLDDVTAVEKTVTKDKTESISTKESHADHMWSGMKCIRGLNQQKACMFWKLCVSRHITLSILKQQSRNLHICIDLWRKHKLIPWTSTKSFIGQEKQWTRIPIAYHAKPINCPMNSHTRELCIRSQPICPMCILYLCVMRNKQILIQN